MKAFITVKNNEGINSEVASRFGRAEYFVIYNLDTDEILSVEENKHREGGHGVGIAITNQLIQSECKLAIGANPGPKVQKIFQEANIKFFKAEDCSIKEAIEKYRKG